MEQWNIPKVYAVRHKKEDVRRESKSGGAFTAISDWALQSNGVVYGCILDENLEAVHCRAEDSLQRDKMRGSKYTQSKLGNTFRNVKRDLINGKSVLFSGCSCQVAGLNKYLGKTYDNLICVDIVCHGIPSPRIWRDYLRYRERQFSSKVIAANFTNKIDYGWRNSIGTLRLANDKRVDSRVYTNLFYNHNALRPCCYKCPYKSTIHPGDITIGDYWGIEKVAPELDDNRGVSLVLINNEKGERIFNLVRDSLLCRETRLQDCMQMPLEKPCPEPENRTLFWKDYSEKGFPYIATKYGKAGLRDLLACKFNKLKRKLKNG